MLQIRCMKCMKNYDEQYGVCPHCGYKRGAEPVNPLYLPEGTVLDGRYLVGTVIGQGGFGITYIAFDQSIERKVAIKEYFPYGLSTRTSESPTVMPMTTQDAGENYRFGKEKFIEEARTLARFSETDSIVTVLTCFLENNTAYFAMEYLEGEDLLHYVQSKGGKLSWDETLGLLEPVFNALEAIHSQGLIHRDLSPDNIFVTKDGKTKLLDFGTARFAMGEKSKSISVILKPGYAPPEQYSSRGKQGPWTDVYALAATIYRLITGEAPADAVDRQMGAALEPPSKLGADIPKSAEEVLMKALALEPEKRIQTIGDFKQQLYKEQQTVVKAGRPENTREVALPASGNFDNQHVPQETHKNAYRKEESEYNPHETRRREHSKVIIGIIAAIIVVIVIIIATSNNLTGPTQETTAAIQTAVVSENANMISQDYTTATENVDTDKIYYSSTNGNGVLNPIYHFVSAVSDGNSIYFTKRWDGLYRMDLDGTNETQISDDPGPSSINVKDGWIYYVSFKYKDGKEVSILCRIKSDGSNKQIIQTYEEMYPTNMQFSDDGYLYYIKYLNYDQEANGYNTPRLFKVQINEAGEEQVLWECGLEVWNFYYDKTLIYAESADGTQYMIDPMTGGYQESDASFHLENGLTVYLTNNKKPLFDDNGQEISSYNFTDDTFYYFCSDSGILYWYHNGEKKYYVVEDCNWAWIGCIAGEWVFMETQISINDISYTNYYMLKDFGDQIQCIQYYRE